MREVLEPGLEYRPEHLRGETFECVLRVDKLDPSIPDEVLARIWAGEVIRLLCWLFAASLAVGVLRLSFLLPRSWVRIALTVVCVWYAGTVTWRYLVQARNTLQLRRLSIWGAALLVHLIVELPGRLLFTLAVVSLVLASHQIHRQGTIWMAYNRRVPSHRQQHYAARLPDYYWGGVVVVFFALGATLWTTERHLWRTFVAALVLLWYLTEREARFVFGVGCVSLGFTAYVNYPDHCSPFRLRLKPGPRWVRALVMVVPTVLLAASFASARIRLPKDNLYTLYSRAHASANLRQRLADEEEKSWKSERSRREFLAKLSALDLEEQPEIDLDLSGLLPGLALTSLCPVPLAFLVLTLLGARTLSFYYLALEAPQATEVPNVSAAP